ncbi:hypothetical protein ACQ4PT_025511 [Festuca glaucescens]
MQSHTRHVSSFAKGVQVLVASLADDSPFNSDRRSRYSTLYCDLGPSLLYETVPLVYVLRVNVLFKHIQKMLTSDNAVIAETGDSWFHCQKLKLPEGCGVNFLSVLNTFRVAVVTAAWHSDATIHAFDNDLEDLDPALPAATGYLGPANAYRVASGEESDGYNDDDDDDARSDDSLDDPKLVLFQVDNMCFQKRQALGKRKRTRRQESIAGTRQH